MMPKTRLFVLISVWLFFYLALRIPGVDASQIFPMLFLDRFSPQRVCLGRLFKFFNIALSRSPRGQRFQRGSGCSTRGQGLLFPSSPGAGQARWRPRATLSGEALVPSLPVIFFPAQQGRDDSGQAAVGNSKKGGRNSTARLPESWILPGDQWFPNQTGDHVTKPVCISQPR